MIINNIFKKCQIILPFYFLLCSCNNKNDSYESLYEREIFVFGTLVNLKIWHNKTTTAELALNEINATFNDMHNRWHAWKPGKLSDINQALRSGRSILISEEEKAFIQTASQLSDLSDHYFNPAIGELISLWGFHTDTYPITTAPPDAAVIDALATKKINMQALSFEGLYLSSDETHIWIDFGGIAKGYAVDKAIDILKKHQIKNAIINAGGDLRSIGKKGNDAWKIAIQSPKDWHILATLEVDRDESIFTSGNYQRYKQFDGKRYAHILNPFTAYPVDQIVSATVIADNGVLADAAATALIVAGTENWLNIAQKMGIDQALLIDDNHRCYGTEKMIRRLIKPQLSCKIITP